MKFVALFSLFTLFSSPVYSNIAGRIIGGSDAKAGEFPFTAAIYIHTSSGQYFCAGALLSREWILTGAQCVDGALQFTIVLGSNNLQDSNDPNRVKVATEEYYLYPKYDAFTLQHDIALIKLRLPIEYSDYIQPILLPTAELVDYSVVVALGWGQTSDEDAGNVSDLHRVSITVLSNQECRNTYGTQIIEEMVCAEGNYNQGTCHGDSGGPLIQYVYGQSATHVGVSSFFSGNGCESTDPSGFTRTFPYVEWIRNVTQIRKDKPFLHRYLRLKYYITKLASQFKHNNKMKVFWSVILCLSVCLKPSSLTKNIANTRIIGGRQARAGQFPFSAAIFAKTFDSAVFCAGALLSNRWILTAGHCVENGTEFVITLGSNSLSDDDPNRLNVSTSNYFLHPEFNRTTLDNNIALLELRQNIEFNDYIAKIHLPVKAYGSDVNVVAIGWGQVSDLEPGPVDHLNYVDLVTISNEHCKIYFGPHVTDNVVCVNGIFNEGPCVGDSGSPLIYYLDDRHPIAIGVSSFLSSRGCESLDPSGYMRVFPYLNWIYNITGGLD
nr:PREDICTED: serine protease H115 isoform X1 [Tribolium castaneum]|eukprot:XP_015835202.1 PREDICTED: serine protease H115 isoform X1 [Tribolium castaneum]